MTYLVGFAALAAACFLGGWYWCLIAALAIIHQLWVSRNTVELLKRVAPGMVWLIAFAATQDRRLFFPFAIHFAATFGTLWGAGMVVAAFTAIRVVQNASVPVLSVELIVAAVAAAAALLCHRRLGPTFSAIIASVLAFAGLSL